MKLVIEGDKRKIKRLAKELRIRLKRDKLIATTEEVVNENDAMIKEHWKIVVEKIEKAISLDELKQFENDDRKSVEKALKDKTLELTQ